VIVTIPSGTKTYRVRGALVRTCSATALPRALVDIVDSMTNAEVERHYTTCEDLVVISRPALALQLASHQLQGSRAWS